MTVDTNNVDSSHSNPDEEVDTNPLKGVFSPNFSDDDGEEIGEKAEDKAQPAESKKEPEPEKGDKDKAKPAEGDDELDESKVDADKLPAKEQGILKAFIAQKRKRQEVQQQAKEKQEELEAQIAALQARIDGKGREPEGETQPEARAESDAIIKVKMDMSLAALKREIGEDKAQEIIESWVAISDGNPELINQMNAAADPAYFAKSYLDNMDKQAERSKYKSEDEYIEAKVQERLAALTGKSSNSKGAESQDAAPELTPDIIGTGSADTDYSADGEQGGQSELSRLLNNTNF